jgi:hypothetical protein
MKILDMVYFLTHDLYNIVLDCNSHHKNFHGEQVYQVRWSWSLQWFGPYLAYNASILDDATTLTFDLTSNRLLSFIMVTKRNPEAYSTAYKLFLLSNVTTLTFDLEKQKGSSSHGGDKVYQVVWS